MNNNQDKFGKLLLVVIALLLLLNLFKSSIFPIATAQEQGETGRYRMEIWSVQGNSSSFNPNGYYGYYIIDTKTGKIVDERLNNL